MLEGGWKKVWKHSFTSRAWSPTCGSGYWLCFNQLAKSFRALLVFLRLLEGILPPLLCCCPSAGVSSCEEAAEPLKKRLWGSHHYGVLWKIIAAQFSSQIHYDTNEFSVLFGTVQYFKRWIILMCFPVPCSLGFYCISTDTDENGVSSIANCWRARW